MTTVSANHKSQFTNHKALHRATRQLQEASIATPALDARRLLEHALGVSREELLLKMDEAMVPEQQAIYDVLIEKRAARQPVAQLTGKREFWGLELRVTEDTLDPRPDSETLVEAALAQFPDRARPLKILDLGTGSGCLLLALLSEFPNATGLGVDISKEALAIAHQNALSSGLDSRVTFLASDWCETVSGVFDLIVSNPPYIETDAIKTLDPEVSQFEPKVALDGGDDGLACYRRIAAAAPALLAAGGFLMVEIGAFQQEAVETLLKQNGWHVAGVWCDLQQIPRTIVSTR